MGEYVYLQVVALEEEEKTLLRMEALVTPVAPMAGVVVVMGTVEIETLGSKGEGGEKGVEEDEGLVRVMEMRKALEVEESEEGLETEEEGVSGDVAMMMELTRVHGQEDLAGVVVEGVLGGVRKMVMGMKSRVHDQGGLVAGEVEGDEEGLAGVGEMIMKMRKEVSSLEVVAGEEEDLGVDETRMETRMMGKVQVAVVEVEGVVSDEERGVRKMRTTLKVSRLTQSCSLGGVDSNTCLVCCSSTIHVVRNHTDSDLQFTVFSL